jgi:histidinol-phosphate aminotransferase
VTSAERPTEAPVEPRDDLRALEGYHSAQVDVAVRLNTNESPYAPPPGFVEEWTQRLAQVPLHRYPDRSARDLRRALGRHLAQPVERLFCANGSNEVLQTLLLTYGGAGRRVAVFEPTYALHSHIARITGTEVVVGERGADFAIDPGSAAALLRETRPTITLLCSPNNPTATVERPETVATLLDATDGLVVVDEAYGEFADWSALGLIDDGGRLVVVRTYSKVWSMASLRLGFCVAPPWVVAELEKVVLPYHLAVPTQLAGILALDHVTEMDARVSWLVEERTRVVDALTGLPGLTVFPSGANFVLVQVDGDGHALWQRLVDRGVLVRDFARWPRLDNCLRITIGTAAENDACLAALREALEEVPVT